MILIFTALGIVCGWLIMLCGDFLLGLSGQHDTAMRCATSTVRLRFTHTICWIDVGVAVSMAGLFALLYRLHGLSAETFWLMFLCAFFALIMLMDWKYRVVLNLLTYPGLVVALAVNIILLGQPVPPILLGLLFAFATFFLASLLVPGGLGGGDVKLAALIGAVLGFPLVLGALIVGALASAVTIVVLITIFRRTLKDSIPYAPFLCLGVLAILIYRSTWVL